MQRNMPSLYAHLKKYNINFKTIVYEWLMTFFCGFVQDEMCALVLDNFILDGWPAIYRIAVAIFRLYEDEFMQTNDMY
jgi:hypothetical protein